MLRQLLMLPVRLCVSVLEVALVTFLSTCSRIFNQLPVAVMAWVDRCRSTMVAMATVIVVMLVIIWVSIFTYWSFYYAYVPAVSHIKDVNFVFTSKHETRGPSDFPAANMSLSSSGQQGVLMRGQQYAVSLDLDMPESPSNRELGMFMVRLDLYTKHGEVVRSAQRAVSVMLSYKSTLHRIAETIFFLPLLIYDFSEQKQNVLIVLFTNFVEDPYKPVLGAYVELETRFIELYKATLIIEARFTGLRYLLFTWPVTSAVVGVGVITFFLTLIALLSWFNLFWAVPESTVAPFTGSVPTDLTNPDPGYNKFLQAKERQQLASRAPRTFRNYAMAIRNYYTFCTWLWVMLIWPEPNDMRCWLESLTATRHHTGSTKNALYHIRLLKGTILNNSNMCGVRILRLAKNILTGVGGDHQVHQQASGIHPAWQGDHHGRITPVSSRFQTIGGASRSVVSFDRTRHMTHTDVAVQDGLLNFHQKWAKNLQHHDQSWILQLHPSLMPGLCRMWTYTPMLMTAPSTAQDQPLLVFLADRGTICAPYLVKKWRAALKAIGEDPKDYTLHGIRRAAATVALESGISEHEVQRFGGWTLDAHRVYITRRASRRVNESLLSAMAH